MPNPESNPAPSTPAPPQQTTPISNAAPGSEAQSKLASELEKMFPGGAIPDGGRFNSELDMMRRAGRASSLAAAEATPPGSTIAQQPVVQPVAPQPVVQPVVQPTPPVAPAGPTGPVAATGATGASGPAAPVEKTEDERKAEADAAAIKAAAEAGKKPLSEADKDAAQASMTVQAGTAFKALRGELKTISESLSAKDREIAELRGKLTSTVSTDEATKLREQLQKTQERLSVFDYKSTDEYQSKVVQPLSTVDGELSALAVKNQVSEEELSAALNNPDPNKRSDKLAELSTNFNRLDLNRFDRLIAAREDLQLFGSQLEAQAKDKLTSYQQHQQEEQAKLQEQMQQEWHKSLDTSYEDLSKRMPIFKPTGDPQFDADMAAAVQGVKALDISKLSNERVAEILYKEAAFGLVLGLVTNLHNKNTELDARVKQLSGTAAPAGGGNPTPVEATKPAFTSMQDAIRSLPQIIPQTV